jgi:16S rRNA (guanine527-N7)-methyltransferase
MPKSPRRPLRSAVRSPATADPAPTGPERDEARRALRHAADAHRIAVPPGAEDGLAAYLALLLRWRGARRITGPAEPESLAVEAIVDALFVDPLVPAEGRILDVGSGAGLPGIPLAILRPVREVTLVESHAGRVGLLRLAVAILGLERTAVLPLRGEDLADRIARGEREPADVAIARAFLPPEKWLALAERLVRPAGATLVLATDRWPGPEAPWRVVDRRDYRLHDRAPRTVWRLTRSGNVAVPAAV